MRIAIVRLSSLGDVIVSSAFLGAVRRRAQGRATHITWIVDSSFRAILEDSPLIDEVCGIPLRAAKGQKSLVFGILKTLRALEPFDLVLDFQGLLKSAIIGRILRRKGDFVGFGADSARERFAAIFYTKTAHIAYERHILERHFALLDAAFGGESGAKSDGESRGSFGGESKRESSGESRCESTKHWDFSLLDSRILLPSNAAKERILGLLGGEDSGDNAGGKKMKFLFVVESSKKEKEYPPERFLALAQGLKAAFKHCKIYLIWQKNEREIRELGARDSAFCVLPRLNLDEIKALVGAMDAVIGGDTGITHLSWAMKIPSVTLFLTTPMARFALCGESYAALSAENGEITPQKILEALRGILPPRLAHPHAAQNNAQNAATTAASAPEERKC